MKPVPILFVGDSPALQSGLSRIGRDLACFVSKLPQYRVGFLGRGGFASGQLPFFQQPYPEYDQWGEAWLARTWQTFAGDQPGVIFTIWDASRLGWFANPIGIDGALGEMLQSGHFQRWGYFPVDSYGVGRKLTTMSADTIRRYDRALAYGAFGSRIISESIGHPIDWIPHGYNSDVFIPRDRTAARMSMGFKEKDLVIGCVMTNQARKDWGLAFATVARLLNAHSNLVFWAHVDVIERSWDLRALAADFGLIPKNVVITTASSMTDTELSYAYSACDLTILPSLGEGFGYPIIESMACGVPVIHGNYGGGVDLIPRSAWLVEPVAERLETSNNCVRPVFTPPDWVEAVESVIAAPPSQQLCTSAVEHLDWKKLWPGAWRKWFEDGLHL